MVKGLIETPFDQLTIKVVVITQSGIDISTFNYQICYKNYNSRFNISIISHLGIN